MMLKPCLSIMSTKVNPTQIFCLVSDLFYYFPFCCPQTTKTASSLHNCLVWDPDPFDSCPSARPKVCVALEYQWTSTNRELQNPQPWSFNPALFSFTVMKMDFFPSQHTEALGWQGAQCKLWWCDQTCHVNKTRGRWARATQSENRVDYSLVQ